jgi:hypothetical protein
VGALLLKRPKADALKPYLVLMRVRLCGQCHVGATVMWPLSWLVPWFGISSQDFCSIFYARISLSFQDFGSMYGSALFCSFGCRICTSHYFWWPRPSVSPSILSFVLFLDLAVKRMFCSLVVVNTWSGHMLICVVCGRKISGVELQTIQRAASYCQLYKFFPLTIFRRGQWTVWSLRTIIHTFF